ncbi:D-alanyl-D-alanine carboxypeptidase/D-alanyl-D-alanine-endopeptidase [Arthrobacter sp. AL08]|uniref:D-alanyl-D-alanine carboxypeptidase/D-alanyl-D-alanine endopeptidase n=1 Tax=unclassified Arthrobacter TaxID=235627 RepID=UPI00249BB4E4|nr:MULTISPECIES: D-alanyl-D-alanine carboxypeptidase/D-alanyl-D-alanine-endopeptidase [unclassified Arthrobacter]MDI3240913.1 D-alanyl-D-alanine carboxypeptidase/D-alanyl-D-alanine-endopeptidase [Arthrobacter sp. AL05]MDI3277111.1 D-alanyl-D-alanine carboxypeptidase/D-alanyl-D-alanine-endopeptidase [Arthrobacter sp. AL08]
MKRRTSRPGARPATGPLRRNLPLLLQTLLVAALALPAGVALAPAFRGPASSAATGENTPTWQQVPGTLAPRGGTAAGSGGIEPLTAAAPRPAPGDLAAQLNETLKTDGAGDFTGMVQDALTGDVLFDRSGDAVRVPASNMKLLTAAAALRTLGPERRFSTRAVAGNAPGTVVLTGGGDVLLGAGESVPDAVLGHAGLATLAQSTVRALEAGNVTGPLTVQLDDSLFTGPALNPAWSPEDVAAGEVAPLFPLALNSARFDPASTTGPRPQDAAMTAAEAFYAQLSTAAAAAGLSVAPGVGRVPAGTAEGDAEARVLAEVQSATVGQQVDLLLRTSDNYLAETMGRMAATAAGKPGSNDGAVAAVLEQLDDLEIPAGTLRAADVSGLALDNQVSARQLAGVVRAITSGTDTRLRSALAGFPVAGLTGTLGDRYMDAATARGAGLVRAKTGTLNTVLALSGYVVDADGRLLVFSFIGNGLTPGAANKAVLDRAASVLAGCGCR